MRIAILQPGYMPWLGFFEQMCLTDHFVYLDDVQYTKKDWRNRNRIKTANGVSWLTVPTRKAPRDTPINRIEISYDQPWSARHLRTIKLEAAIEIRHKYLHDLNAAVVDLFRDILGIATPISRSSELGIETHDKNEKVWRICNALDADELYDGQAARSFLDVDAFKRNGIKVTFQNYVHPTYVQCWGTFVPFLSTLDLLMNCGANAREIILAESSPKRTGIHARPPLALTGKGVATA